MTMADVQQRREAVLDVLRANPQGLTIQQIADAIGITVNAVNDDIRRLRRDKDIDNIPCQPNGLRQPWLYRVTNDIALNRWWARNRIEDQEARFQTEVGMAATLVNVTDGRSIEGRKARKIHRVLGYLMQELADLERETVQV